MDACSITLSAKCMIVEEKMKLGEGKSFEMGECLEFYYDFFVDS